MEHCVWIQEQLSEEQIIKKRLDELDKKSIRDAEDLFDILVLKGIITADEVCFIKERKEQKKALREQLKGLDILI